MANTTEMPKKASSTLRDKILQTDDLKSELVVVPEWDNLEIKLVGLSARDFDRMRASATNPKTGQVNDTESNVYALIESAVDPETGEKLFSLADKDALMTKNVVVIGRLGTKIMDLCGLTEAAREAAEKNLKPEGNSGSTTNSLKS